MLDIGIDRIAKRYANGVTALNGVTLGVPAGKCLALVGPSGCGKTTLLRVIAGLEHATSGLVRLGGHVVNHLPAHQRQVAMAFQCPALVPGKSVRENLMWSWTVRDGNLLRRLFQRRRHNPDERNELDRITRLLGIEDLLDRRASELSGGQQQRVALGRALLRRAPICLLDEPLGHLESALRTQLRRDLRLLSREFPATMIHVTHDPAEALAVGDEVAVLHDGRLQQVAPPAEVVRRPANRFVAEFCHGGGSLNFVEGRFDQDGFVAAPWLRLPVPEQIRPLDDGDAVTLGIDRREVKILPEHAADCAAANTMQMDVVVTEFASDGWWVTCRRDGIQMTGLKSGHQVAAGSKVMVALTVNDAFWFDTESGRTLWAPAG
jgi:ABC-type sugar transport system ATPase subunit